MYRPYNEDRPGIRVPVDINFISATNASGVVAASSTKRYYVMGWDLTVPSGTTIARFKFKDGTSDVSGEFSASYILENSGNSLYHIGLNKPIQIKVNVPCRIIGDIFYKEVDVVTKQTTASKYIFGTHPELLD